MLISEILNGIEYKSIINDIDIKKVTSRLNLIEENTLFVFIIGIKFDTRKIIKDIISKKPSVIVTDVDLPEIQTIDVIKVSNVRYAYSLMMWNFCKIERYKSKFYAVTGTNGKTTTATMLYNIFSYAKIKCGFIGTGKIIIDGVLVSDENYSMTTPDPELLYPVIKQMQEYGCEKIIMEISSHSLYLYKVAPIIFECSMFTNLSEEHMDFHKTIEEYYTAKLSLFYQSKLGIFNVDDEYAKRAMCDLKLSTECHSVGIKNDADSMAKDIIFNSFSGTSYIYREKEKLFKIELFQGGIYNVSNSLLAIKCALLSGITPTEIKESFKALKCIDGRLEMINENPTVIIDYAHTVFAAESVLKFINSSKKQGQKLITVFGCGGERDSAMRPKFAAISEKYSDISVVTSDNSRNENTEKIINEIVSGFSKNASFEVIKNRKEAIRRAISLAGDFDIVAIIGKGHERYNIDFDGYHKFDEKEIVRNALSERHKK